MERLFYEYFTNVFTTTNRIISQMDAVLRDMLVKVNREMNNQLDTTFTEEEVSKALA